MWRRWGAATVAMMLLASCGWWDESWFGEAEGPPLPGERLSVLTHASTLSPDPELSDAEILLPEPIVNADWPQAGGFANHAMHHLAAGEALAVAWKRDIGAGADDAERFIASPIIAEGRVYAMDTETQISAFEAESGRKLWDVELTPDEDEGHMGGGLAFEYGRVFVATGFAEVVALEATTGKVLWRKEVGAPMRSAPTARGGRVFVVTLENKLHALNAADGKTLWTHAGIPEEASILGGASPAVDEDIVVVPYSSGELVALRAESGRDLWTDSLTSVRRTDVISTLAQIRGNPVIDRGRVYAVGHNELMAATDLRTGQRVWEREIGSLSTPWIAGDYLYVLTNDKELVCLAARTGRIFWVRALPRWEDEEDREDPIIWTGPILVSDRLIVAGSHGEAYAVSPYTGRILGRQELPDGVSVPPVVAGGTVYVLADDATLVALR